MVEIYKSETFDGVPKFVIEDNFMFIGLSSYKIAKNMGYNVQKEEEIKLETILILLNTREMIEWFE